MQVAARAAIFRRDQGSVQGLEAMKAMMRYNDYGRDNVREDAWARRVACMQGRGAWSMQGL